MRASPVLGRTVGRPREDEERADVRTAGGRTCQQSGPVTVEVPDFA